MNKRKFYKNKEISMMNNLMNNLIIKIEIKTLVIYSQVVKILMGLVKVKDLT